MLASEPKSRFREALISEPRSLVLLATRGGLNFDSVSDSRLLVLLELLLSRWCGTVWFWVPLVLPFCITGSLLRQIEGTRPWSNVLRLLQGYNYTPINSSERSSHLNFMFTYVTNHHPSWETRTTSTTSSTLMLSSSSFWAVWDLITFLSVPTTLSCVLVLLSTIGWR